MTLRPYDYAVMVADPVRMGSYVRALEQTVRPGDVVLDLGCGTGAMAIVAAKLGAKKVYALDSNTCAELVPRMAAANDCAEKIHAICADSRVTNLPEKVDVIVFDLRGVLPLYGKSVEVLVDARNRFLKPGGKLIPLRDTICVGLATAPDLHAKLIQPWGENSYGVDWSALDGVFSSLWANRRIPENGIVSPPVPWVELDYQSVSSGDFSKVVHCVSERTTEVHGFFVWFNCELAPGIEFSGGPGSELKVYGSAFFPWPEPVRLVEGDRVSIDLSAKSVEPEYIWTWRTSFESRPELVFEQSSFSTTTWSLAQFKKRAAQFAPSLSLSGEVDLYILGRMQSGALLGEIARSVFSEFPGRFKSEAEALGHVGKLSILYAA